jgi:hypothetical protein
MVMEVCGRAGSSANGSQIAARDIEGAPEQNIAPNDTRSETCFLQLGPTYKSFHHLPTMPLSDELITVEVRALKIQSPLHN